MFNRNNRAPKSSNGHDLLAELCNAVDDINTRAADRNAVVETRLAELEDEQRSLRAVSDLAAKLSA